MRLYPIIIRVLRLVLLVLAAVVGVVGVLSHRMWFSVLPLNRPVSVNLVAWDGTLSFGLTVPTSVAGMERAERQTRDAPVFELVPPALDLDLPVLKASLIKDKFDGSTLYVVGLNARWWVLVPAILVVYALIVWTSRRRKFGPGFEVTTTEYKYESLSVPSH